LVVLINDYEYEASVCFGSGVFINSVPMNPKTQMPAYASTNKIEIITWVDFNFADFNIAVLPALKTIYNEALSTFVL